MASTKTKAKLSHVSGIRFQGHGENPKHSITFDGSARHGGDDLGIRPMESILTALAACASIDIITILKKSKQLFSQFHVVIHGERREAIPQVFSSIALDFHLFHLDPHSPETKLKQEKVDRAIELSLEKYCSVAAMLRASGVTITYTASLHPPLTKIITKN